MRKFSCAALVAALLVVPLTICAGEAEMAEPEMETVLVTGEQPGPGLWKVSRNGHVMWVLPSIGALPDTISWRTKEVEARIAESQEVLFPGWPRVNVPVLSNKTTSARARLSKYLPPLMSNPRLAAAPMEASMAMGVASAIEHEHATTNTAAVAKGSRRSKNVRVAMPATIGR